MTKISAVINTLNEQDSIERCLKSLKFADEIIIVDMHSSDDTVKIAKKYTRNIYEHRPMPWVEPARNFAIKKAKGDWIVILDPDEEISKTLSHKLIEIADKNKADFVRIPRKNIIFKSWVCHSRWWPDYNIRFFKKGSVVWQDEIHSIPVTYGQGINLPADEKFAITHYHYVSIEQYLTRMNRYSQVQAQELLDKQYKLKPQDILAKPVGEFLSRYFAGQGYKDGLHGLILALLQSFSILIVYLKVWQSQGFKKAPPPPISGYLKEFSFWIFTMQIDLNKNILNRLILRIKRRLNK